MAKSGIRYRPCASLVVDWVVPVPTFVARTVVPGITAPDVSVTVPRTVPAANCAARGTPVTPINSAAHAAITHTHCSFKVLDISHLSLFNSLDGRWKSRIRHPTDRTLAPDVVVTPTPSAACIILPPNRCQDLSPFNFDGAATSC